MHNRFLIDRSNSRALGTILGSPEFRMAVVPPSLTPAAATCTNVGDARYAYLHLPPTRVTVVLLATNQSAPNVLGHIADRLCVHSIAVSKSRGQQDPRTASSGKMKCQMLYSFRSWVTPQLEKLATRVFHSTCLQNNTKHLRARHETSHSRDDDSRQNRKNPATLGRRERRGKRRINSQYDILKHILNQHVDLTLSRFR